MSTMSQTGILGNRAENLALKYLKRAGLKLVERNFSCRVGELDLIMRDGDYLVFTEVRYRKDLDFGGALESIDQRKQQKLRRAAQTYLQKHKLNDCPCRFDILCLTGSVIKPHYQWIKNAF